MRAESHSASCTILPPISNFPLIGFERSTNGCRQSSDFWFADGNIILIAEGVAFKVHRGLLERHSDVFSDTLSLPQPHDGPMFECCQILELHDSSADVSHLMHALYDGLYFKKLSADDFSAISAVLRLSLKYFIEHLRERCIARLAIDWPNTISAWDCRESEGTDHFGHYNPRARFAHPIEVINFARQIGLDGILPCAFYDLCRYGPSKIVSGVRERKIGFAQKSNCTETRNSSTPRQLSLSDIEIALTGRETAQRTMANFIEEELSSRPVSIDCHNKDREGGRECKESFYSIMLNLLRSIGGIAPGRDCDPLFTLTQAVDMMARNDFSDGVQHCSLQICAACKADFATTVRISREHIWMQIPSWFGMKDYSGESRILA